MKAFIKAISYYLPEQVVTNDLLAGEFPEWSAEKMTSKIGIIQRHIAAEDETAADMGIQAAKKMFGEHSIQPEEIDFVLYCTQSPDYFLPTSACIIQSELNIPTSAGALDFNLGCSGFVYGLSLAKGLIFGGVAKNVLLITSETYSKYIHPKDKGNRTIFGDAATATLISSNGFAEIKNFSLGTDGRGAKNLIVTSGGHRNPQKSNVISWDESNNPISEDHLYMNGSEILNFTLEAVPIMVKDTLEKNDLTLDEIELVVFHQANKYMLNFLRRKLKIEPEKFFYFMENVGNTVSSTIPIALYEAQKENKLHNNVLLAGFGVGYSWAGTILKIN